MSRLGATGWSSIGSRYGTWFFWLLAIGVIILFVLIVFLVLSAFGFLQWLLSTIAFYAWIVCIIWAILFFGTLLVILKDFVTDLGDNFYAKWKTAGIGPAFKGLVSDVKTCGGALVNGIGQVVKEKWGAFVGGLKKFFGIK